MSINIFCQSAKSRNLLNRFGQHCRGLSTTASESSPHVSGVNSVWQTFVIGFRERAPGIVLGTLATGTIGTVGYLCNREFSRFDHNLADVNQQIQNTNTRIDETNARIDQTNARIDDTAKTINARIDQTNARIDQVGTKIDGLKDLIIQINMQTLQNQQKKSSWW